MDSKKSLADWLHFIAHVHPTTVELGLDRVQEVAKRLNVISPPCPIVTIGGTNGKGSCVATLESIYSAAGYRVGAYTSPHLLRFNERIRINKLELEDDEICKAFGEIERVRGEISLTYFEFTTLAALYIFHVTRLDIILLEVGLGGRLDAVNIINPDVCVLTQVSLDHCHYLGGDRESIGREKAGIFRLNTPVVYGESSPPYAVLDRARRLKAPFYQLNEHFYYQQQGQAWSWAGPASQYDFLPLPQVLLSNAATSLMVVALLQAKLPISKTALQLGLQAVFLPGRLQMLNEEQILLDVSHNPAGTQNLAQYLSKHLNARKVMAVCGMLADKLIAQSLAPLIDKVDSWYVGDLNAPRAAKGLILQEKLQAMAVKRCYNHSSIQAAYKQAQAACCSKQDCVVVFGSFYTVAEVMLLLNQERVV